MSKIFTSILNFVSNAIDDFIKTEEEELEIIDKFTDNLLRAIRIKR